MAFRLATYNVHKFTGTDGRRDEQRTQNILRAIDADVIALQEVVLENEGDDPSAIEAFARALKYHVIAQPMRRASGMVQYNLLLTRLPVRSHNLIGLPRNGHEARGAIHAELEFEDKPFCVAATHLGLAPSTRMRQLSTLLGVCALGGDQPFALLGDLNLLLPWELPRFLLEKRFPGQRQAASYPSRLPLIAFDAVYLHGMQSVNPLQAFTQGEARTASDHLPVVANVAL